jgi:hypothetical protein
MGPSRSRATRIVKVHPTKLREFATKKKSPGKTKGGHPVPVDKPDERLARSRGESP